MKKIIQLLILAVIFGCILAGCDLAEPASRDYFGFDLSKYTVVEKDSTHRALNGDGFYYLILDCSDDTDSARKIVEDWERLPLAEPLKAVMNTVFGEDSTVMDEAHWPNTENAVYKFFDRHTEATDPSDPSELMDRYSYNFTVALYDLDTDTMYYFEMDT